MLQIVFYQVNTICIFIGNALEGALCEVLESVSYTAPSRIGVELSPNVAVRAAGLFKSVSFCDDARP